MAINILELNNLNSLHFLDWDYITEELASGAYFEVTQQRLKGPPRFNPQEIIETSLNAISYLIESETDHISILINELRDIPFQSEHFKLVDHLSKARIFNIKELNYFANLFNVFMSIRKSYLNTPIFKDWDLDNNFSREIRRNFYNPLRDFVEPNGNVNYQKHPALSKIFNEIIKIEKGIRERIRTISNSPLYKDALQYSEHDTINDHFVLAVRSDSYNSQQGPIVGRSASGLTLFVSPPELSEKNSKRLQLMAELEEIMNRICAGFSEVLHPFSNELKIIQEKIILIDEYLAKAQYSLKKKLYRPEISKSKKLLLNSFFHPLIEDPVVNNIEIPEDKKGLLISGPNTGGKTVSLKSIAISHLFVHLGLFVPAKRAEIYPFRKIFYFSHDQQDLKSGLSSFASEAHNYLSLLREIDNDESLILIDEIFNSTSSEEASALAISLLEEIHNRSQSLVFISTHHQFLKAFIHKMENLVSGHVGFNALTHGPTYKLNIGTPGGSMAFDIFENICEKLRIKSPMAQRAREILESDQINYEDLINDVLKKQTQLDELIHQNRLREKELRDEKKRQEGLLSLEKDKILQDFQNNLKQLLKEAEKISVEVKKGHLGKKGVQKRISEVTQKARSIDGENSETFTYQKVENIEVGQTLFSYLFKKNVLVEKVNKDKVFIRLGNKGLWCEKDSLGLPSGKIKKSAKVHVSRNIPAKLEYDCRGMRLNEFKDLVENIFVSIENGELPYALFIHGHGDGVLKDYIRKRFKDRSDVDCTPYEGNDGCTKIELI